MTTRCDWANGGPLEITYHDAAWGVPFRDDRHFFEMLILAQREELEALRW